MPLTTDADLYHLLSHARTIAVVGASNRPDRPSYGVMAALLRHGYRVVPVNPQLAGQSIHGETVVATLAETGGPIDIVDIFRKSADVPPVVEAAIATGARAVWMQIGVVNPAAAAAAEAAGLGVVMDRCPKIELARLRIAPI